MEKKSQECRKMRVNICGLKHEVIECEDKFNMDCHLGQIEYKDLMISKKLLKPKKKRTEKK